MSVRAWIKLGGLGTAGLIVAAVLAVLALQLVSQPVGLSSEPVTAGDRLVPRASGTGATEATPQTSVTETSGGSRSGGAHSTAGTRSKKDDDARARAAEPDESSAREDATGDEGHDEHGGEEGHDD